MEILDVQRPCVVRLVVGLCTLAVICYSQSATLAQNKSVAPRTVSHSATGVVDGANSPDLIPDTIGYALFFTAASKRHGASADETARQRAFLSAAHLSESDLMVIASVLDDYQRDFTKLSSPGTVKSEEPAGARRDALVASTIVALSTRMTSDGWNRLSAVVRSEKRKMRIATAPIQEANHDAHH